ncbi:MAG: hypothetical protein ACKV1O_05695 [Saprospiraceae bacterium]
MDKNFILKTVNRISVADLFEYISNGIVSFEELRATGKLHHEKQVELRELIDKFRIDTEKEKALWEHALMQDTIEAYQQYFQEYPNGRYHENAQNKIALLRREVQDRKQKLLDDIKKREHHYTAFSIRELIRKEELTEADLVSEGIISETALQLLLNPPVIFPTLDWKELPALKDYATDLYFFGIPSSGKSCLLSGILFYANRHGGLELEIDNQVGLEYAHSLIRSVDVGYVPPASPIESVNYISAKIFDEKEAPHPINIIEMSGEFFNETYRTTSLNGERSIGANGYLSNQNRKVIFLIIDYKKDISPSDASVADQSQQLSTVLKLLEKDKTLSKTDALFLVLSKSDLLPGGVNDLKSAEEFIDSKYLSLRKYVRRLSEKFKFNTAIHTFSLGQFMLEKTFKYDEYASEILYKEITELTFPLKESGAKRPSKWNIFR